MTNNEIIYKAVAAQIGTAQTNALIAQYGSLPLHTFAEWKKAGRIVKRGEHAALTVDLWVCRSSTKEVEMPDGTTEEANLQHFTMKKSVLFWATQTESK